MLKRLPSFVIKTHPVKVLVKHPQRSPRVHTCMFDKDFVANTLGGFAEAISVKSDGFRSLQLLVNEDRCRMRLQNNFVFGDDVIAGSALLVAYVVALPRCAPKAVDLTDDEALYYAQTFAAEAV